MIRLEEMTARCNVNPQPNLLHNRWIINNTFVYHLITEKARHRITVPPRSAHFKQIRPRRLRAEMVRGSLRQFKRAGPAYYSWAQADAAYIQTLRADGCHPLFCAWEAVRLTGFGLFTKAWRYWRVPTRPKTTSGVPQPTE